MTAKQRRQASTSPALMLATCLIAMPASPAQAQDAVSARPQEPQWLSSPRIVASVSAVPAIGLPPGLLSTQVEPSTPSGVRSPTLSFAGDEAAPPSAGYSSGADPCSKENLNRNDGPLSQRINCQGLGIPPGWMQSPAVR